MSTALENERRIGSHLRVRRWHHRAEAVLAGQQTAHDAFEIAWVEKGLVRYRIGQRHFDVEAGQAMVVPAGVGHATSISARAEAGSVWVGPNVVATLFDAVGRGEKGLEPTLCTDAARLISLGRLLQAEAFDTAPGGALAADALSEVLVLQAFRVSSSSQRRQPTCAQVRRALERIESDYAQALDVELLAREAGMSRYHFSRRFHEQVGTSPYAFVQETRLKRSAELLRRGHVSVSEAAFSCGFSDLSRFGQKFRERFGCLPSQFSSKLGAAARIA